LLRIEIVCAACEGFGNLYPVKEVQINTVIQRLVTTNFSGHRKFLIVGSAHQATKELNLRRYPLQAVDQLQWRETVTRIQYLISSFYA
jgi:hypothetical protein